MLICARKGLLIRRSLPLALITLRWPTSETNHFDLQLDDRAISVIAHNRFSLLRWCKYSRRAKSNRIVFELDSLLFFSFHWKSYKQRCILLLQNLK
jgi:hypothetical protein